ncbi:MAG: response regulator [Gammaproteobacteria bacterium]|nr:response regulator [Gammaproteobacteria bacterium]
MTNKKILIVDDEPYVARILKLVLQKEGYKVTCVNNGKAALDICASLQPDILVTDVKMPHLGGRELVETIRSLESGSNIPIVVMTSTLESENREWVHDQGNISFLGKPVSPRDLVRVINSHFIHSKAS